VLIAGDVLGDCEILTPLGRGGMGEVYLARDRRLGRKVAVKVLPAFLSSDASRLARFEREARSSNGRLDIGCRELEGGRGGIERLRAVERLQEWRECWGQGG